MNIVVYMGVALITMEEQQKLNILRRSFLRNQQPEGLVGLEYLEEESDLVYVQKRSLNLQLNTVLYVEF